MHSLIGASGRMVAIYWLTELTHSDPKLSATLFLGPLTSWKCLVNNLEVVPDSNEGYICKKKGGEFAMQISPGDSTHFNYKSVCFALKFCLPLIKRCLSNEWPTLIPMPLACSSTDQTEQGRWSRLALSWNWISLTFCLVLARNCPSQLQKLPWSFLNGSLIYRTAIHSKLSKLIIILEAPYNRVSLGNLLLGIWKHCKSRR